MRKNSSICFFFLTCLLCISRPVKAASLQSFIPEGYAILDSVSGQLNKDSLTDMILVLKRINEDSISASSDFAIKRETVILLGTGKNEYKVVGRNMNVVYCVTCGGVMGDPYVGCSIADHSFSISHYGGAVWRWGRVTTFKFNAAGKLVLVEDENTTFNATNEKETTETTVKTSKDFGVITFDQFDIDKE